MMRGSGRVGCARPAPSSCRSRPPAAPARRSASRSCPCGSPPISTPCCAPGAPSTGSPWRPSSGAWWRGSSRASCRPATDGRVGMIELRRAEPGDVAELREIAAAAYAVYAPRIGRPPAPVAADYAGAVDRGEVWVAAEDQQITGLLVLIERPGHLLLENVAVRPSAQGQGTGSRLLELAEREAAGMGL